MLAGSRYEARDHFWICLGFMAAALAAHSNALTTPFFSDDIANIVLKAPFLERSGPWEAIPTVSPDRPMQALLFWLNFKMSGLNPVAYRVCGAILHGLLGFAVYLLYSAFARMHLGVRTTRGAAVAAFLYFLTPVHNQAVILIAQRGVLLCTLFSVLSLRSFLLYAWNEKRSELLLSYLWFVLALLSKGTAIAVLPIVLLYSAIYRHRIFSKAWVFVPYAVLGGALLYAAYFMLKLNPQLSPLSPLQYLSVETRVLFIYFRLLFWPLQLRYSYDVDLDPNPLLNLTWLAIVAHLAILGAAFAYRKRQPALLLAVFSAYFAFAPESSLFPIDHVIWEYRTCFPFVFLFGALGVVFSEAISRLNAGWRAIAVYVPCALLPAFIAIHHARNDDMATPMKWVHDVLKWNRHDHLFNFNILAEFYYRKEYKDGARVSEELAAANPDVDSYAYYRTIFRYALDPGRLKREDLESLASKLRDPKSFPMHSATRNALNAFILDELPRYVPAASVDEKVEDLLFPQIAELMDRAFNSKGMYATYHAALNRLIEVYEATQRQRILKKDEEASFLKLLAAREVFYGMKSEGLSAKFEEFLAKNPEAVLTPRIYQWYLSSRDLRAK